MKLQLDKITKERLEKKDLTEILNETFDDIDSKDAYMLEKISAFERELKTFRTETTNSFKAVREDINALKENIGGMRADMNTLNENMDYLKTSMETLLNHFQLNPGKDILNDNKK